MKRLRVQVGEAPARMVVQLPDKSSVNSLYAWTLRY
jgi:hypothetical protein